MSLAVGIEGRHVHTQDETSALHVILIGMTFYCNIKGHTHARALKFRPQFTTHAYGAVYASS